MPDCRTAGLPDCRTAGLPDCRTAGLPDCRTAGLPDCRTAGLPDCRTAGLPDCRTAVNPSWLQRWFRGRFEQPPDASSARTHVPGASASPRSSPVSARRNAASPAFAVGTDARSAARGRRRVLALAVAPLLSGAPDVGAEIPVTNFSRTATASAVSFGTPPPGRWDLAQGFTTGSHAGGYSLTAIEIPFGSAIGAAHIGDLMAQVRSGDGSGKRHGFGRSGRS